MMGLKPFRRMQQPIDHAARIRPAIDIVANEDKAARAGCGRCIAHDLFQQRIEQVGAAMHIAHRIDAMRFLRRWRGRARETARTGRGAWLFSGAKNSWGVSIVAFQIASPSPWGKACGVDPLQKRALTRGLPDECLYRR